MGKVVELDLASVNLFIYESLTTDSLNQTTNLLNNTQRVKYNFYNFLQKKKKFLIKFKNHTFPLKIFL